MGISAHQLIGYNLRVESADSLQEADTAFIDVYDPNYPEDPQRELKIDVSAQSEKPILNGDGNGCIGVYTRFALIGPSRPTVADAIPFTKLIVNDIFDNFIDGWVEIAANSPVQIDAVAPDGTELKHPEESVNGTPPSEIVYLTGAPAGDYEIKVEGTGDGEYTLDVRGSTPEGGVVEDSVTDTITEGATQTVAATVPEEEGQEGSVEPAPQASDYANQNSVIDNSGLQRAVEDWREGKMETSLLRDIVEYWRTGDPVS